MGSVKTRIERAVLTEQYVLVGEGRFEETEAGSIVKGLCQRIQFFDIGHREHVRKG